MIATLSLPILLSLIAEPLTGLIDTAFVARLGVAQLAALGVAATALSAVFWIFNFLGIGTQTEVAQAGGSGRRNQAARQTTLALLLSIAIGVLLIVVGWPLLPWGARQLGAEGAVAAGAISYMQIRLFGAPALLITLTAFGALRGQQDMRTPLWIALLVNGLNILLDWLLIFGAGPVPALGIAGAALASVIAQWIGGLLALLLVLRRTGWSTDGRFSDLRRLLRTGGDLFIRTGLLTLFLLLSTRIANQSGVENGAAHQAVRQVWLLTAMALDALALTAQSLIGYYHGAGDRLQMRRVARLTCAWGVGLGVLLGLLMWLLGDWIAVWLLPERAIAPFLAAWRVVALLQPVAAVSFVSDGIHWGTGDYRYLRNGMLLATLSSALALYAIDPANPNALVLIWLVAGGWNLLRALAGVVRIWPGVGHSPFSLDSGKTPAHGASY